MNIKRNLYIAIGCIALALGAIGSVLPLIPTFPFLLLAAFCFGKSSKRLHDWFIETNLYKKNLETYMQGKGMPMKAKLRIVTMVTLLMGFGFIMMKDVLIGRVVLAVVWVVHIVYFFFGVKTLEEQ